VEVMSGMKNKPTKTGSKQLDVFSDDENDVDKEEERRRKKELRRAEKLAALGLDEHGNEQDNYSRSCDAFSGKRFAAIGLAVSVQELEQFSLLPYPVRNECSAPGKAPPVLPS
jgi:hypothetical protein